MEPVTLVAITVAIAVVAVLVGSLISYMSSLVKNAYQIKVELRRDMETALGEMHSNIEKQQEWLKRTMMEESKNVHTAMETANTKALEEMKATLIALTTEALETGRAERDALAQQMNILETRIGMLEQEGEARKVLARQMREKMDAKGEASPAPSADARTGSERGRAPLGPTVVGQRNVSTGSDDGQE